MNKISMFIILSFMVNVYVLHPHETRPEVKALACAARKAHIEAVFPYLHNWFGKMPLLTMKQSTIIATLLTLQPCMAFSGVSAGIASGYAARCVTSDMDNVYKWARSGFSAGIAVGFVAPYFCWNKYFQYRVKKKFNEILINASPEICSDMLEYIQEKSAPLFAEKYFEGDERALDIFCDVLQIKTPLSIR